MTSITSQQILNSPQPNNVCTIEHLDGLREYDGLTVADTNANLQQLQVILCRCWT